MDTFGKVYKMFTDFPSALPSRNNLRKRLAPSTTASVSSAPPFVDLGPVIKAPLDAKHYKVVQLPNGLRACLVSTCVHRTDKPGEENGNKIESIDAQATSSNDAYISSLLLQQEIDDFNKTHLNIAPCSEPLVAKLDTNETSDPPDVPPLIPPPQKSPKIIRCCKGKGTIGVTVGAGSFHDPKGISGLAHCVEHLIFLGSKQHPEPNKLFNRVFENGGLVNATTFAEHTNFYFSCALDAFEECIHILVDGLSNPRFRENDIRREIEVIDSEYGIKQTCDYTRVSDFLRTCAKKDHPFSKFYWGNKHTLGLADIQKHAKNWKSRYYTANNMTVCIQAPMPMDKLEKLLVKHFSDIPSSPPGTKSPTEELLSHGSPFEPENFKTEYRIAPLTHLTCLVISWALSSEYWKNYETKPLEYIRALLQNTKPGGLKHFLRQKGWMTEWINLTVNCCPFDDLCRNAYCSFFNISITLTDKGYEEREEVIMAVFSYLKMLSLGGVRARTFEEMKTSAAIKFHYSNWDEMLQSGVNIAVNMQNEIPPEHILTSKCLLTKWDPELIKNCLNALRPKDANFCLVSSTNGKTCQQSAWPSGIKYQKKGFDKFFYQDLENVKVYPEFKLPPNGTFLTKPISLNEKSFLAEQSSKRCLGVVYDSEKLLVTHLNTKKSPCMAPRLPSAYYSVYFSSHLVSSHASRMKQGVLDYWSRLLLDNIVELVGHQFDHLFTFDVAVNDDGISVHLGGPRCYLVELLTIVVRQVFVCGNDEDKNKGTLKIAEGLRVDLVREYCNKIYDVETLSKDMLIYLQRANHASLFEIRNEIKEVCVGSGDLSHMIKKFRRRMMVSVELEGAVTLEDVWDVVNLFTGKTDGKIEYEKPAILPEYTDRATILPKGSSWLCIQALHPAYVTSVVTNFYQVDWWDGRDPQEFLRILFLLMRRRLPNRLRTIEQLGYTARLVPHHIDGDSLGLSVTVLTHPHKFSTEYVDKRIDAFFRYFYDKCLKDPEMRNDISEWFELSEQRMQELDRFYRECFLKNGSNFRKLSIQVEGFKPKTKISSKKMDELTGDKSVGGRCAREDDNGNKGSAEDINFGYYDSMIELEYMTPNNEEEKRKLKREAIRVIENITRFKRELGLLPVSPSP